MVGGPGYASSAAVTASPSNRPRSVSRDGEAQRRQTAHGESVVVTQRVQNGALVRVSQASEGARREEYRIEGGALVVQVTVSSPRLPRAVTYRLTYRR